MKIKEKVITEAKKRIEKRLVDIEELLTANPLSKICDLRIEAQKILEENKGDYTKIGELIEPLAKEEKHLFSIAKKQTDSIKLIDEKVKLTCELSELNNEIYYMNK